MQEVGANVFNLRINPRKRINMYVGKVVTAVWEETGQNYLAQITSINKVVIVDGEVFFDVNVAVIN